MSVMSGGTALNGFRIGGKESSSAGSAGMVMTFSAFHVSPSRYHRKMAPDKSFVEMTTPTNCRRVQIRMVSFEQISGPPNTCFQGTDDLPPRLLRDHCVIVSVRGRGCLLQEETYCDGR